MLTAVESKIIPGKIPANQYHYNKLEKIYPENKNKKEIKITIPPSPTQNFRITVSRMEAQYEKNINRSIGE